MFNRNSERGEGPSWVKVLQTSSPSIFPTVDESPPVDEYLVRKNCTHSHIKTKDERKCYSMKIMMKRKRYLDRWWNTKKSNCESISIICGTLLDCHGFNYDAIPIMMIFVMILNKKTYMLKLPAADMSVGNQSVMWTIWCATLPGLAMYGDHRRPAPRTPPSQIDAFTWGLLTSHQYVNVSILCQLM